MSVLSADWLCSALYCMIVVMKPSSAGISVRDKAANFCVSQRAHGFRSAPRSNSTGTHATDHKATARVFALQYLMIPAISLQVSASRMRWPVRPACSWLAAAMWCQVTSSCTPPKGCDNIHGILDARNELSIRLDEHDIKTFSSVHLASRSSELDRMNIIACHSETSQS